MIAASEEFLDGIKLHLIWRGSSSIGADDMFGAALWAGANLRPKEHIDRFSGTSFFSDMSHYIVARRAMSMAGIERCGVHIDAERSAEKVREAVAQGMPFISWAIGETRRFSGNAQPGEGDFIKYLGRDDGDAVPLDVIRLCDLCDERPATHDLHDNTYVDCIDKVCEPCLETQWDRQQEKRAEDAC